jgi:hypothetical protein
MPKIQINNVVREMTSEEAAQLAADEQAWADGADDRAAAANRETRNQLLSDSDWTQMPDSPLTDEAKALWVTYRTALRDITSHANWPNLEEADWPTKP